MSTQRRLQVLRGHFSNHSNTGNDQIIPNETSMASFALKTWREKPAPQQISREGKAIVVVSLTAYFLM
jgi:hypothetical protein